MEFYYFVLLWTAITQVTVAENSTATVAVNMTAAVAGNMTATATTGGSTSETMEDEPVSRLKTTAAGNFERIVLTSTLGNYNPHVVLQKAALLQDSNLVIEEGVKNNTFAERFVYLKPGGEVAIPCNKLKLNTTEDATSIKYKWTDQLGVDLVAKPKKGVEEDRVWIDYKYQLCLSDVKPEDSGNYFCIIQTVRPKKTTYFTNEIHFLVYSEPDLGIGFPFVFEAPNCNDKRNILKLDEVRSSLCPIKPCLYIFDIECTITPWFLNYTHVSKTVVVIMAIKVPHPNYRAPHCSHDCIMSNKFDHIITDMTTLQRTITDLTDTADMIYVKQETMAKRKLVFLCHPGFEIHRENCVPCLPGKYQDSFGVGVCKKCPKDHYQSHAAGNSCVPCDLNYGTAAEGTRLSTACYRKIRIIQYTIPFFIACGVLGGIILIVLALCCAKYTPRCLAWLKAQRKKDQVEEVEKPLKSTDALFEKFLDLAAHAITARDAAIAKSGMATVRHGMIYDMPQPAVAYQDPMNVQKQPPAVLLSATGNISPVPLGGEQKTEIPVLVPPGVRASKLTLGSDNLSRVAQGTNRSKMTLITDRSSLPESKMESSRPTSQRDADSPRSEDATKISAAAQTTVIKAGESPVLKIPTVKQETEKVLIDKESTVPPAKIASQNTMAIKQPEKVIVDKESTVPASKIASENTTAIKQSEKVIVDKEPTVPGSKLASQVVPEPSTQNRNFNHYLSSLYNFPNYPPIFPYPSYPMFNYFTPPIMNLPPINRQITSQNNNQQYTVETRQITSQNNNQQYSAEIVVYPKNAKKHHSRTQIIREAACLNSKTAAIPNMNRSSISSMVQQIVGVNSDWTGVLVTDLPPPYRSPHSRRSHHSHRRAKKKSH